MAIQFCGLPLRAHPDLSSTLLPWLSQNLRTNWKQILGYFGLIFIVTMYLTMSIQGYSFRHLTYDKEAQLWRSSKSVDYKLYDMRSNALQMSDYSDPILVDVPVESTGSSQLSVDKKDVEDDSDLSYGVVIDCGSSGSRAFLYTWKRHSGDAKDLLQIKQVVRDNESVVMKITPGIATFASSPNRIESYLRPLVTFIKEEIPYEKQRETPLYILCTAGMRMLTKKHQTLILDKIQLTFQRYTNFYFLPSHVEVISGLTEGLYFWLAVNYMHGNLKKVRHVENSIDLIRSQTYGVLDMGGGSLQIAFEVSSENRHLFPKNVMEIDVGCSSNDHSHAFNVFVDTFLHKGGNAVRGMYERDIVSNFSLLNTSSRFIFDPCLPKGYIQEVKLKQSSTNGVVYMLNGTGDFMSCKNRLVSYLEKSDCSQPEHCFLNSRLAPFINHDRMKFIGMSEFFYCMDDILQIGGTYDKTYYEDKASQYCNTPWNMTWQNFKDGKYNADINRLKLQCFKSAWVSTVLHEGLNFPDRNENLQTIKHINGSEVHWTWGAILYKTRFLPLLEIQRRRKHEASLKMSSHGFYPVALLAHSGIFLFFCIVIALLYLILSLIKFCLYARNVKGQSLKRVGSSFAQFVHEEV